MNSSPDLSRPPNVSSYSGTQIQPGQSNHLTPFTTKPNLGHTPFQEKGTYCIFAQRTSKPDRGPRRGARPTPPAPLPYRGGAPPLRKLARGGDSAEAWRGGEGGRAEAGARAFLCGSWHLPDWFCRCCCRSGRSQPAPARCPVFARSCRRRSAPRSRRARPGGAASGRAVGGCAPRSLGSALSPASPAPRTLAPAFLTATPPVCTRPSLPPPAPLPAVPRALQPPERRGHGHPRDAASCRVPSAHQDLARGGRQPQSRPEIPLRALHRTRSSPEPLQLVSGRCQAGLGGNLGGRAASDLSDGAGLGDLDPGAPSPVARALPAGS